ncbi:MAG: cytochrome-c peroxidase [Lewinellaceae bacterium]|nr:cytochrome-c peroxidase [Saprospiraceae bacterium]MCB9338079.1 cytochrome-c peroxidase [Lewinellaceae bacterium]
MNLTWASSLMWDGAVNHLDMQALAPISSHVEMDERMENVVKKLQEKYPYPSLFFEAYNDSLIIGEHLPKALSQFELTLISAKQMAGSCDKRTCCRAARDATWTPAHYTPGYILWQSAWRGRPFIVGRSYCSDNDKLLFFKAGS